MAIEFKSFERHFEEVRKLQVSLQEKKSLFSLGKNSISNTLRNGNYKKGTAQLNLSSFDQVLEINLTEGWILVEPRITFKKLCGMTLPQGWMPLVVPEFSTITVGGAIMGAALESTSHRFGQVNDTCLEYELLLGNGELVKASPAQNADLFYALPGSYGTLALLTAVKLKIMPTKKWVHLTYQRFSDPKEAASFLASPLKVDFAEGIVFSPEHAVIILGEMTDEPKGISYRQNHYWSPWYAQHVLHTQNKEECMPIEEYLFRLDRGAFWMGKYIHSFWTMIRLLFRLGIPKVKNHSLNPSPLFRGLFGWAFSSKKLYRIWHGVPNEIAENLFFIHDFYTPVSQAPEILSRFMRETGIFPIWLCPLKGARSPQYFSPHYGDSNFLNIGLYGIPQNSQPIPTLGAQLEEEILNFGGRKMLYSFTYYSPETFSKFYFSEKYKELRQKYSAETAFPPLFNKVTNRL